MNIEFIQNQVLCKSICALPLAVMTAITLYDEKTKVEQWRIF